MSLKRKIALGFLVSACIVAVLSAFLYANFARIKDETAFLELTDTLHSKSLQVRRYEKNYFLYAPTKAGEESVAIHRYLREIEETLGGVGGAGRERAAALGPLIRDYREQFDRIETLLALVTAESGALGARSPAYAAVSTLAAANFLDRPLEDVAYLQREFGLRADHPLISSLGELDLRIAALRKTGESLLTASRELDRSAREEVDAVIRASRIAILVIYPLFLLVGFGAAMIVTGNAAKRLRRLADLLDETGRGAFPAAPLPLVRAGGDEVDTLIGKFYAMELQLQQREKELLQSKKLAAIGTLAAGVAHELNNPLNNIYTTAQRLIRKTGAECPAPIQKGLDDIFGQTMRVKGIVGDLLEFARGREPHLRAVEICGLAEASFRLLGSSRDTARVRFSLACRPERIVVDADQEQLERVFLNLFANAVDAMPQGGELSVSAEEEQGQVLVRIADTGRGMPPETAEKIFEPFFSTKERGTGLGLAIVFSIVQKHRGEIRVESAEGRGTTFALTLPKGAGEDAA
jgi:signal transduction histidine kinase